MKQNYTFETGKKILKCLLALAAIMCVIALAVNENGGGLARYAAFVAIACVAAVVFIVATCMKCPYCGRHIIRKCLVIKVCPHCGRDLASGMKRKKKK